MKVSTLQEGFLKEFGLTLRVYDGRSFADPTQTLGQVRKKKGTLLEETRNRGLPHLIEQDITYGGGRMRLVHGHRAEPAPPGNLLSINALSRNSFEFLGSLRG
jgi:hypothetical protein